MGRRMKRTSEEEREKEKRKAKRNRLEKVLNLISFESPPYLIRFFTYLDLSLCLREILSSALFWTAFSSSFALNSESKTPFFMASALNFLKKKNIPSFTLQQIFVSFLLSCFYLFSSPQFITYWLFLLSNFNIFLPPLSFVTLFLIL